MSSESKEKEKSTVETTVTAPTNAEPPLSPGVVKTATSAKAQPKKPVAQSRPAPKPAPKPASAQPEAIPQPEPEPEPEPAPAKSNPFDIFGW
jgi:hypothetical protein